MELRQLEYLVAVVEEGSFTRAAQRVHITQSGISAQVLELERDLGARLIDRTTRRLALTPAGAAVIEHARGALASASAARDAVDAVTGLVRGRLALAMVRGCTIAPFFEAISTFHDAHPGVDLLLTEGDSDDLVRQLRSGDADVALIGTADLPPAGLHALPVVSEQVVAAAPTGNPLVTGQPAGLTELGEHPLACLPAGTGVRSVFDRACAEAGVRPRIAFEASAPGAVAGLAERGLGVAVLSASMVAPTGDRLTAVPVRGLSAPAHLALAWTPATSRAGEVFVDHARRAFDLPLRRDASSAGQLPGHRTTTPTAVP